VDNDRVEVLVDEQRAATTTASRCSRAATCAMRSAAASRNGGTDGPGVDLEFAGG